MWWHNSYNNNNRVCWELTKVWLVNLKAFFRGHLWEKKGDWEQSPVLKLISCSHSCCVRQWNTTDCKQSHVNSHSLLKVVIGNNQVVRKHGCSKHMWQFTITSSFSHFPQGSDWKQSDGFGSSGGQSKVMVYNHMFVLKVYSMQWLETIRWI